MREFAENTYVEFRTLDDRQIPIDHRAVGYDEIVLWGDPGSASWTTLYFREEHYDDPIFKILPNEMSMHFRMYKEFDGGAIVDLAKGIFHIEWVSYCDTDTTGWNSMTVKMAGLLSQKPQMPTQETVYKRREIPR